jgi:hypothetical protein
VKFDVLNSLNILLKTILVFSRSKESKHSFVNCANGTRFDPGHTHLTEKVAENLPDCMGLVFSCRIPLPHSEPTHCGKYVNILVEHLFPYAWARL